MNELSAARPIQMRWWQRDKEKNETKRTWINLRPSRNGWPKENSNSSSATIKYSKRIQFPFGMFVTAIKLSSVDTLHAPKGIWIIYLFHKAINAICDSSGEIGFLYSILARSVHCVLRRKCVNCGGIKTVFDSCGFNLQIQCQHRRRSQHPNSSDKRIILCWSRLSETNSQNDKSIDHCKSLVRRETFSRIDCV